MLPRLRDRESTCSCAKLLKRMPRPLFKRNKEPEKRRNKKSRSLLIKRHVTRESMKLSLKSRELRRRKNAKSSD